MIVASISQDFVQAVLKHVGIPPKAIEVNKRLYTQSDCNVTFGGISIEGFDLEAGVRQCCPLS